MNVVVFGPAEETPKFDRIARHIGEMIGQNGHALVTGGCPGPTRMVARYAYTSGCRNSRAVSHARFVKLDQPDRESCYTKVEIAVLVAVRAAWMMDEAELAIAFAGGTGTLCEIEILSNDRPKVPLVLVGERWSTELDFARRSFASRRVPDPRLALHSFVFGASANTVPYLAPDTLDVLLRA